MRKEINTTLIGKSVIIFLALCAIIVGLIPTGLLFYGIYLAFKASIILGIIVLIVEPTPFIIGLLALFGLNIAAIIQNWIHFPI